MKKMIIPFLAAVCLMLGACTDSKSGEINDGKYHPPGEKKHTEHEHTPGDTTHVDEHQHEPGDTTHNH